MQRQNKLTREFYHRDAVIVAEDLLGKILVHEVAGHKLRARIVETEAYMGILDKAAHSYGGKRTKRVEVMYGPSGYSYVYLIYGMYHCFNIVTGEEGNPQAVLIRAVEPLEEVDQMAYNRFQMPYTQLPNIKRKIISNGPGKLCKALAINLDYNGKDICGECLYVEDGEKLDFEIVYAKRVGIDYAEEAKDYLWRFYIKNHPCVSVT